MNDLYEFGGTCDVIIRCKSERFIGGRKYEENEPYTILKDVTCGLQYKSINSEANAANNIINSREGLPDLVNIVNVPLTNKVLCLVSEKISHQRIGKIYTGIAKNGIVYLPEAPLQNSVFVYKGNERFISFTVKEDQLVAEFEEDAEYLIFYDVVATESCFDFNCPRYGYFTLEIIGKGNQNKKSNNIYIKIPAASLISTPVFDLVSGNILHAPLQFKVIQQNQPVPYFNLGD